MGFLSPVILLLKFVSTYNFIYCKVDPLKLDGAGATKVRVKVRVKELKGVHPCRISRDGGPLRRVGRIPTRPLGQRLAGIMIDEKATREDTLGRPNPEKGVH